MLQTVYQYINVFFDDFGYWSVFFDSQFNRTHVKVSELW